MSEHEPTVVRRPAQPYVAVRATVTVATFPTLADRMPALFGRLAARGVTPAGAPFFRYRHTAADGALDVEAGVPTPEPVPGEGDVAGDVLPAGRYLEAEHAGPYDGLEASVDATLGWADAHGVALDRTTTPDGVGWGCRLDVLRVSPGTEPDPRRWRTGLVFRVAD